MQRPFMAPEEAHGQVWSLCGDSSSHLLRSYKGGVSVIPEYPKVGEDIQVMVKGYLGKSSKRNKCQRFNELTF